MAAEGAWAERKQDEMDPAAWLPFSSGKLGLPMHCSHATILPTGETWSSHLNSPKIETPSHTYSGACLLGLF